VISSIVIPGLIQDSQQAEFKAAWKKNYSAISQAVKMVASNNGGDLTPYLANGQIFTLIQDYLRIMKKGPGAFPFGNYLVYSLNGNNIKTGSYGSIYLSGLYSSDSNDGAFILSNGTAVIMDWDSPANLVGKCVYVLVDVNGGESSPNVVGKDIFGLIILKNRTIPMGAPIPELGGIAPPNNETTCTSSSSGFACSAKYLYQ
jgi:hypothetical protein